MPKNNDIIWFKSEFEEEIQQAIADTPFTVDMLVAVACQETGYIWSTLRQKGLPTSRVLELCVGDTIDYKAPGKGRQAFPRNKAALVRVPRGKEMFQVARTALVEIAEHIPGYESSVNRPTKFCRGFGVFQRDLQFFKEDPEYFLEKKYSIFSETLSLCLKELKRGLRIRKYEDRSRLSHREFAEVAIVYNTGRYRSARGLKQGHFDGRKYYGEYIVHYLELATQARTADSPDRYDTDTKPYVVIARSGLNLRYGPGLDFGVSAVLKQGQQLFVVDFDGTDNEWARVDLHGDSLIDGHAFAAYLEPVSIDDQREYSEDVEEPDVSHL